MREELKARLRAWCETSNHFGLDSIGKDISQSLDAIEQLQRQLAERDAEIAKYRDAPVVAWINKDHTFVQLSDKSTVYGSHTIPLIVKPGEQ